MGGQSIPVYIMHMVTRAERWNVHTPAGEAKGRIISTHPKTNAQHASSFTSLYGLRLRGYFLHILAACGHVPSQVPNWEGDLLW